MVPYRIFGLLVAILPLAFAVEDLILTPLIRAGNLAKAKEMATDNIKLSHIKSSFNRPMTSYSGYLTTNETYNSNLFFWLFPAIENPETSSVILITNNIPGVSIMQGIFLENGPFTLDENLEMYEQNYTWAKTHTLIYIDTPVGTGFSFTNNEDGLATSSQEEDDEVYEAMKQLYTLFPEYQSRDLYLAGSGYAALTPCILELARVIPKMVETFEESGKKDNFQFNVKGVIIGSLWLDPKHAMKFSDYLLQQGLIDDVQSEMFALEEKKLGELMDQKKYTEATVQMSKIHFVPEAMTYKTTGFTDVHSILQSSLPEGRIRFTKFIDSNQVHNYIHVGLHKFEIMNFKAFLKFYADFGHAELEPFEKLLDKDLKVLIYSPQFDFLVPRLGQERTLNELAWKGKEEFQKAGRTIWKVDDDVAGYVKSSGNLQYVMLRNAGFWAIMDQPKWCYDMVERFTSGKMF